MTQTVILGGPGCGKTTELIRIVEGYLSRGVSAHRIGYLAFTKKAAAEARGRMMEKFGLSQDDIPHFRTIHSLAFRHLGLSTDAVISGKLAKQFAEYAGLTLSKTESDEGRFSTATQDDKAIAALSLSRLTRRSIEDVALDLEVDQSVVKYVKRELEFFKEQRAVIDYTDMLEQFVQYGDAPALDVLIIDEAQDLSRLQWDVVAMIAKNVNTVYIAGDDDQAIYAWAGADVSHFLALGGTRRVLPISYRLRRAVYDAAQKIISHVPNRYAKNWQPHAEGGSVERVSRYSEIPFDKGTWYVLARNKAHLVAASRYLIDRGYPFIHNGHSSVGKPEVRAVLAWEALRKGRELQGSVVQETIAHVKPQLRGGACSFNANETYTLNELLHKQTVLTSDDWRHALDIHPRDRDYYADVKSRGESLIDAPRITLSTIHGVKGGEAENVILLPDMTASTHKAHMHGDATEQRVFFVGASRAKENLYFMAPRTSKCWEVEKYAA